MSSTWFSDGGRRNTAIGALALGVLFLVSASVVPAAAQTEPVTFSKHVAPILQKNCQQCHRPGDIGPMSLRTSATCRPRSAKWSSTSAIAAIV